MRDPADFDGLLFNDDVPEGHRSGYVAVVGRPNVGKSTLMNTFLGEKLAIVSPRPQTTRANQLGILTREGEQIIFVDTPGIHKAFNRLGEFMVGAAQEAIPDADVILFLVDASEEPTISDRIIAERVATVDDTILVILVLNKMDLLSNDEQIERLGAFQELIERAEPTFVSAQEGTHVAELLATISAHLPEGPRYFPPDRLTETYLRDNVAEVIREKVLLLLDQEVPYSIAVQIEEFKERSADLTYVRATIFVERESQKGIVIGKKGAMLKAIGREARPDIEAVIGTRVYLDLWVKVLKNWRKDDDALRKLGYSRPQ